MKSPLSLPAQPFFFTKEKVHGAQKERAFLQTKRNLFEKVNVGGKVKSPLSLAAKTLGCSFYNP